VNARETWETPRSLYDALNLEFSFTFDPCPLMDEREAGMSLWGTDGLSKSWHGQRVYCNPPYGRGVGDWLAKAQEADLAVYLLPSRTDTAWWHDYAMKASEIRFLRGRLRFGSARYNAPFPSVVLVYRNNTLGKSNAEA
jgi:site-specific DNA-methyltransferase (adenine-specific)